jgi:Domain of Unknown Function (DUF1080)
MRTAILTLVMTLAMPVSAYAGKGHAAHASHHAAHHKAPKAHKAHKAKAPKGHKGHPKGGHAHKGHATAKHHHAQKHHVAHGALLRHAHGHVVHRGANHSTVVRKSVSHSHTGVASSSSHSYSSSWSAGYGSRRHHVGGSSYVDGSSSTYINGSTYIKPGGGKKPSAKFVSIFNGKDLAGWTVRGNVAAFAVEHGVLVANGGAKGWLISSKHYGNFEMTLRYRVLESTGGAVAVRVADKGKIPDVGTVINLKGQVAAKPASEWNELRVSVRGPTLTVEVNGESLPSASTARPNGLLALESDRGRVEFRDLYIKELP